MLKTFFKNIEKLNSGEINKIDSHTKYQTMTLDDFELSCRIVKNNDPNRMSYYIDYQLSYFINNKRYLLDEGDFTYGWNRLNEDKPSTTLCVERRFPNFLEYKDELATKYVKTVTKPQYERYTDITYYEHIYSNINKIDDDIAPYFKPTMREVKDNFMEDYLKVSKLIVKALVISAKEYCDEQNAK